MRVENSSHLIALRERRLRPNPPVDPDPTPSNPDTSAMVDGTEYGTVQEALDAVEAGKPVTVKLFKDTETPVTVKKGTNVTLDLNDTLMTGTTDAAITVEDGAELTIKGTGIIDAGNAPKKAAIVNKGTMSILGGTITRSEETGTASNVSGKNSYYAIYNTGTIKEIGKDAVITNTSGYSSLICCIGTADKPARIDKITGGRFTNNFVVLKLDDYSSLGEISGGTFINNQDDFNKGPSATILAYGPIDKISGGTFECKAETPFKVLGYYDTSAKVCQTGVVKEITGGTFKTGLMETCGSLSASVHPVSVNDIDKFTELPSVKSITGGTFIGNVFTENSGVIEGIAGGSFTLRDAESEKAMEAFLKDGFKLSGGSDNKWTVALG